MSCKVLASTHLAREPRCRVFVRDSSARKIYSGEKDLCSEFPGADNSGWKFLGSRIGGGPGDCK
jgi:hypothetical protein